jgi:hypothetical protein
LKEFARKGNYEIYAVSVSGPFALYTPNKVYAEKGELDNASSEST